MKTQSHMKELRAFLLLWSSQAVSSLGTAMTEYALVVWAYGREGTASSVTLLTLCSFMPTILFRFAAGALADRWNKKRVMLACDLAAACGTAVVLALHTASALTIWHLYVINILLSLMNALQVPASFVATSLLTPKEHYARASGLQGVSGAAVSILAPALGASLLAFGGLRAVLVCDLATFAVAFFTLLFFIRVPEPERAAKERGEPFLKSCMGGVNYLRGHAVLLRLILFMACINFLAKLGNDGMLAPFVLGRTGGDQQVLGAVETSVAFGLLAGSLLVTWMKPVKDKLRLIFLTTAAIFLGNIAQSLTGRPWLWCAAAFLSYAVAAVMNANFTVFMRERVPVEMQGRVFSAKDTLQNCSIPLGLFLGGVLADHVFEPFMAPDSPGAEALSALFGAGQGAGVGVMFFCAGVLGVALCLAQVGRKAFREEA